MAGCADEQPVGGIDIAEFEAAEETNLERHIEDGAWTDRQIRL